MIVYNMIGKFGEGEKFKDFFTADAKSKVCIQEDPDHQSREPESPVLAKDGWYDAKVSTLEEYTAKAVLAKINNVTVEEIGIVVLPAPPKTTAYA